MIRALRLDVDGKLSELELGTEGGLQLKALCRAMGCSTVDLVRLAPGIDMWVDDEGWLTREPQPNRAATFLARCFGRAGQIAGTVVFTGGGDAEGATRGLSELGVRKIRELLGAA